MSFEEKEEKLEKEKERAWTVEEGLKKEQKREIKKKIKRKKK